MNLFPSLPSAASARAGAALVLALVPVAALWSTALPAQAGPGHDHDEAPATASVGSALPRFATSTELFELVGVLKDRQLTLYLDHSASNAPVKGATLELEIAGAKLPVQASGDGEFQATLAQALPEGVSPVVASVSTAEASDLLAAEIDVHRDAAADAHGHGLDWRKTWPWALALAVAAALLLVRFRRQRLGGAA